MLKKAQMEGLHPMVFVIAIGLVVVSIILFVGFKAISGIGTTAEEVGMAGFQSAVSDDLQLVAAKYGTVTEKSYALPEKVKKVCFVDLEKVDLESPSLAFYPIIRDSIASGGTHNMFVYGNTFLYSSRIGTISFSEYPYFKCFDVIGGLNLMMKGTGKGAQLVTNFGVIREVPKHIVKDTVLNSDDKLAKLELSGGTEVQGSQEIEVRPVDIKSMDSEPSFKVASEVFQFEPSGTTFEPAATITIQYSPELLEPGTSQEDIQIYYFDGTQWIALPTEVNVNEHTATAKFNHFCQIAVGAGRSSVTRTIEPKDPKPGEAVTVKLKVELSNKNAYAYFIREKVPSGWEVVNPGGGTLVNGMVRWAAHNLERNVLAGSELTYQLRAPSKPGRFSFLGKYVIGTGGLAEIAGDHRITVTRSCTSNALCNDNNRCTEDRCAEGTCTYTQVCAETKNQTEPNAEEPPTEPGGSITNVLVSAPEISANQGDFVTVPISISNANGLSRYQFDVSYNSEVLEYVSTSQGTLQATCTEPTLTTGAIKNIACTSITATNGEGTLQNIKFKAKASGTTSIELSNIKLTSSQVAQITATARNGRVTVQASPSDTGTPTGGTDGTTGIFVSEATAKLGQPVTVNVSVKGLSDVFGFQFNVEFSSNVLRFVSSQEGPFLKTGGASTYCLGLDGTTAGMVKNIACVRYGNALGVTGSGVIFSLTFNTLGTGDSAIALYNLNVSDSKAANIKTTLHNGMVVVTS